MLRTNGHHTFGTGRDVVGQPVSETHKGPVVMLTEPSKTPLPMKSNSIFHPDMINSIIYTRDQQHEHQLIAFKSVAGGNTICSF